VSRVLKRLQDEGLIRVERRELEILDAARIEELALAVLRH
jgi:CRP/FNR family transcriptional regulator